MTSCLAVDTNYNSVFVQDVTVNRANTAFKSFTSPINSNDEFKNETLKLQHSAPSTGKPIEGYRKLLDDIQLYWKCVGGTCEPSCEVAPYTSEAACKNALTPMAFATGGQCPTIYTVTYQLYRTDMNGVETMNPAINVVQDIAGAIYGVEVSLGAWIDTQGFNSLGYYFVTAHGDIEVGLSQNPTGGLNIIAGRMVVVSVVRKDGQPDNCGNPPFSCPTTNKTVVWQCSGGVCSPTTFANRPYTTKAACTSALVAPPYTGGQCVGIEYVVEFDYIVHSPSYPDQKWASRLNSADIPVGYATLNPMRINGAVVSVMKNATTNIIEARNSTGQLVTEASSIGSIAYGYSVDLTVRGTKRSDALADTCGNLPSTCPV